MRKELGKIKDVRYGFGGYQGVQFGLSVHLGGDGWGVSDFWGCWGDEPSEHAKWTRADQLGWFADTADRICKLLKSAKVQGVEDLEGVPVEVTFDGMQLKSWRVLTEVI